MRHAGQNIDGFVRFLCQNYGTLVGVLDHIIGEHGGISDCRGDAGIRAILLWANDAGDLQLPCVIQQRFLIQCGILLLLIRHV